MKIFLSVLALGLVAAAPEKAPDDKAAIANVIVGEKDDRAHAIGLQLRCPVCQGMPIADSPSTMAQDMMKKVRKMLGEGKSEEEIFAYFARAYGEFALLNPATKGINWLIWLGPPLGLIAGIIFSLMFVRSAQKRKIPTQSEHTDGDKVYLETIRREVEQ